MITLKPKFVTLLVFFIAGLFSLTVTASEPEIENDHSKLLFFLDEPQQLSSSGLQSNSLVVESNYVWSATSDGLYRWSKGDPRSLTIFNSENGLSGSNILDIDRSESGSIWVLSSTGLDLINQDEITNFHSEIWGQLAFTDIEAGHNDTLYLLADRFIFQLSDNILTDISHQFTIPLPEDADSGYVDQANICAANNPNFPRYGRFDSIEFLEIGVLYAFGNLVPDCYFGKDKKWQAPFFNGSSLNINSIQQDQNGEIWIGGSLPVNASEENAIAKINTDFLLQTPDFTQADLISVEGIVGLDFGEINQINFDSDNNLWILTNYLGKNIGGQWETFAHPIDGSSWGGTEGMILDENTPWFFGNAVFMGTGDNATLYANNLLSSSFQMTADKMDNIWVFYDERVARFSVLDGNSFSHLTLGDHYVSDPSHFVQPFDNITWFRSSTLSFYQDGKLTHIDSDQIPFDLLTPHFVDSMGNTWFYDYKFEEPRWEFVENYYKFDDSSFTEFVPKSERPNARLPLEQAPVEQLFEFEGNLWGYVGGYPVPFQYYDHQNQEWGHVEMTITYLDFFDNERPIEITNPIIREDLGQIWALSYFGVVVYQNGNWTLHQFPDISELNDASVFDYSQTIDPEHMLMRSGKIWFIREEGLVSFDGIEMQTYDYPETLLNLAEFDTFRKNSNELAVGNNNEIWIYGRDLPGRPNSTFVLFKDGQFSGVSSLPPINTYRPFGVNKLYGYNAHEMKFGLWSAFEPTDYQYLPVVRR